MITNMRPPTSPVLVVLPLVESTECGKTRTRGMSWPVFATERTIDISSANEAYLRAKSVETKLSGW